MTLLFPTEKGVVLVHLGFNDAVTPEVARRFHFGNYATGVIDNDIFESILFIMKTTGKKIIVDPFPASPRN